MLQNQHGAGKIAKKWDRTGLVLENMGHNKYRIKVDGSGRVTDRNRQFLRQFTPVTPSQPGPRPDNVIVPTPVAEPEPQRMVEPEPVAPPPQPVEIPLGTNPGAQVPSTPTPVAPSTPTSPATPESPSFVTPPTTPTTVLPPRRSTRVNFGKIPDRLTHEKF